MKKPRIKRPKISSKAPGASPKGVHDGMPANKNRSVPKSTHDRGANLGKYLHKEKPSKLGPAKKIGNVAAVAKAIKSNKRKPGYV
jgi:hypothetical protein